MPGTPRPAGSKRWLPLRGRVGGRPVIVDDNPASATWKRVVRFYALLEVGRRGLRGSLPLQEPAWLRLTFVLARPLGQLAGRKPGAVARSGSPDRPAVRPDLLKLARAVEDALTGVLYADDAQVVIERLEKSYGPQPGVLVELGPVPISGRSKTLPILDSA